MRVGGPAVGLLSTALLAVLAVNYRRTSSGDAATAAALVLFVPSLASIVAARPNEHPYVTRVVLGVRYLTLAPIPLSALSVAAIAAGWPSTVLWVAASVSLVTSIVLGTGMFFTRATPVL